MRRLGPGLGHQGVALFEAQDGAEVHGGSEVNHMALQLAAGEYERVKSILDDLTLRDRILLNIGSATPHVAGLSQLGAESAALIKNLHRSFQGRQNNST